jgi:putative two-component system response regulator
MDVLVVDDNEINSRVYERIVKWLEGYACRCFSRPSAALHWCQTHSPSLVVIDYAMPELDGIAFVRSFRRIPERDRVPIIMLTAMNSARLRDEALAAGVNAFFPKPISPDRFLTEARRLLGIDHDKATS